MCMIYGVLMHIMLFCCKICSFCDLRCFVAKSVLSRFTRFCVEKNLAKNCACGEKRTNIIYASKCKCRKPHEPSGTLTSHSNTRGKVPPNVWYYNRTEGPDCGVWGQWGEVGCSLGRRKESPRAASRHTSPLWHKLWPLNKTFPPTSSSSAS